MPSKDRRENQAAFMSNLAQQRLVGDIEPFPEQFEFVQLRDIALSLIDLRGLLKHAIEDPRELWPRFSSCTLEDQLSRAKACPVRSCRQSCKVSHID